MAIKHSEEYRDADLARPLAEKIRRTSRRSIRLMEVCGTHTVSIFRSGIRSMLPTTVSLLSGPGCPVCVTDQAEIDAFIELARQKDVILATFGDLMRVPGSTSSLQRERAEGRDIRMVYSTVDALTIARTHPGQQVVFLGVGFETTAPTIAAAILTAA
jgi:hydrogenase expression/formation protein HypD